MARAYMKLDGNLIPVSVGTVGTKRTYMKIDGNLIPILIGTVLGSGIPPTIPSRYVQTTSADFNESGDYTGTAEYIILPVDKPSGYKIVNINVKGVATNGDYLTDTSEMFSGNNSLYLELNYLDTSNVTMMYNMFSGAQATTLDLSNFDTSNVISMQGMFQNSRATTLDLSSFDTSNVQVMYGMFNGSRATELDLSGFDTSNVTRMDYMFLNSRATTLDLSSFDTSNVTNMDFMFVSAQATTGYARTQTDADNLNNSALKPNTITFVVKSQGETWLINNSPSGYNLYENIDFESNGKRYSRISLSEEPVPGVGIALVLYYTGYDDWTTAATNWAWTDQAYRTVTFETAPTGELLSWLQANAVKQ